MNSEFVGVLFGVIIGLILCVVIFLVCNKDRKIKSEYDERQEAIRGKSYKLGFYTVDVYLALLTIFFIGEFEIPFTLPILSFFGVALGISVVGIHSIWNGAYWGINNIKTRYIIVMGICAVINLWAGFAGIIHGDALLGHQTSLINLICGIMLLCIGIACLIKKCLDANTARDEEE